MATRTHARGLKKRDRLISKHIDLAGRIAREMAARLPAQFDVEDLAAEGHIGLIFAAERYRPRAHGGTPFRAYARPWIRGAILSAVRREWSDGKGRHAIKPLTEALPAGEMGAAVSDPGALEDALDAQRRARSITLAVETLPEAEKGLLRAVYSPISMNAARTVRAAAAELGIPESRAYRLHNSGINALRARLA